ncbi:DUF4179 domain-containing protein [Sporosarcina sp. ACRSM]|uniref:DUF4179 domain-containing protein n=1 Tax=Sporosarcina sp. ACRSM TaxID=2918216 RepID=UPI001EF58DF3|nr:DUF4179 domain-containing protein [Sporosarcina sp. ACRSM]MCG7334660.1 DUF4179 domain-containing protein [Sporosarcina sp. ACRSM]
MKCPTVDELSKYVDDRQAYKDIANHVKSCTECQRVVAAFESEQHFIKETLQTPTLPDDFTAMVLDQLEPYEQKMQWKKSKPWKRILLSAAGVVLALGVSATLNPSFAEWIGGMFSPEQADSNAAIVDDGLRMATEAGLAERVNLEVQDNGITFKVEDVVIDSSRVALSFQVLNQKGKPQDTQLNLIDSGNKITVIDQNGERFDQMGTGWQENSDYGIVEIPIGKQPALEKVTVNFDLVELNGIKGNWALEVPIDVTKHKNLTKIVQIEDASTSHHGVTIDMKEIRFAPSTTELTYETGFTKEEQARVWNEIQQLEAQIGGKSVKDELALRKYGTALEYHIENEDKKTIYRNIHGTLLYEERQPGDLIRTQGSGNEGTQLGQVIWNQTFIPQKGNPKNTLVLDGVYKTVPSDFSVSFKPKELKRNPVSFEYEGNFITIKKAKKQGEYSLRKALIPVERESVFTIKMEGGMEETASDLDTWILTDGKGNSYPTYGNENILFEKDKNGRYKTSVDLKVYDLKEVPEELTLHLVSVTRYEEVKERWEVPLYE